MTGPLFKLDMKTGVPVYRQLIDQVLAGIATGGLRAGDRLPTSRQVAVDLAINPNTVARAYKELEIRGVLTTQQGIGTFVSQNGPEPDELERRRQLNQFVADLVARAGGQGFQVDEVVELLIEYCAEEAKPKPGERRD